VRVFGAFCERSQHNEAEGDGGDLGSSGGRSPSPHPGEGRVGWDVPARKL